jgi:hypothetical protein
MSLAFSSLFVGLFSALATRFAAHPGLRPSRIVFATANPFPIARSLHRQVFGLALFPAFVASFLLPSAHASTLTVTNLNDSGTGSLRAEILAASSGDTIVFNSGLTGTITLTSGTLAIGAGVTIIGPGANVITVSGNNASTVFTINGAISVTIAGLTIANGNTTTEGGGISLATAGGSLTVSNCTFSGNFAQIYGGAIFNNGTLAVTGSTFNGNSADSLGGAIINYGNFNSTSAVIINSTFVGNKSGGGGAIENSAARTGNTNSLTVFNSTFYGNSATEGGAIANPLTLGGVTTITVTNSVFSGNVANASSDGGAGIYNGASGTVANVSYSVFWNNTEFFGGEDDCFQCTTNVNATDADPMLLPLENFGGNTPTMLPYPTSAAICAGSSLLVPGGVTTDQRGFPLMPSTCTEGSVDAGADQTNYLIVNNLTDVDDDGFCTTTKCTIVDALYQAEDNGGLADIGFQTGLTGTITLTSPLPAIVTTENIEIVGPGVSNMAISGGGSSTVGSIFTVDTGSQATFYGLTITDGNTSGDGGGILSHGALTVNTCTLSGNFAGNLAGAIEALAGSLTIINSTFSGNSTTYNAGAIRSDTLVPLTVSSSTINNNTAGSSAGGILAYGTATITNSTFANNSATESGPGGILTYGTITVSNSTFSGNSAGIAGGALINYGTATVTDSIFSGNSTSRNIGAGILNAGGGTLNASFNVFYNNLDAGTTEDDCNNCTSNSNPIDANPMLAPLDSYGGPTQTMLPLPGSAAICSGETSLFPAGVTLDQRGYPVDSRCASGAADVGAVQTAYTMYFYGQPPANVTPTVAFSGPTVKLFESGVVAAAASSPITITGSDWPITGTTTVNLSAGEADFNNLIATDLTTGETLKATLALNPLLVPALNLTATSDPIHVTRNNQTITFTPIAFDQNVLTTVPLSATATSSLTVTFISLTPATCTVSGTTASLNDYGFCTIEAKQAGTIEIAPAPNVEQTFFIHHATQTISFPAISFNQNADSTLPLSATSSAGLTVTFASLTPATCAVSGTTASLNAYGFCTIQTSQPGNSVYGEAAHVDQTVFIHHLTQTIDFGPISSQAEGSLQLSATASSGLTVAFASLTPSVCTVSGTTATLSAPGTCTIEATQAGNTVYGDAPAVKQSFAVIGSVSSGNH